MLLKHEAEQTAPEVLTDEQLELVSGGLFKEIIAAAEKGYTTGSSVAGTGGGIVGGAIGAACGFWGSLFG